jgi:hypothetical protein
MSKNMTRLLALQPLSRDHGSILFCANWSRKAVRVSRHDRLRLAEKLRIICRDEILYYLDEEQTILSQFAIDPLLKNVFRHNYENLRKAILDLENMCPGLDPGLGRMATLAAEFEIYVRWAENFLFPWLEQRLSYEDVQELFKVTAHLEAKRNRPTQTLRTSVALEMTTGLPDIGVIHVYIPRKECQDSPRLRVV